jgi:hypothetical protein
VLHVEKVLVSVKSLDDFDLRPDFVKSYIQGLEPEAIIGAEQTLLKCQPTILAPCRSPVVDKLLRSFGYERFGCKIDGINNGYFTKGDEGSYFSWYMTSHGISHLPESVLRI